MTTPKRWIDGRSDASDFERTLLQAELDAAPPPGSEADVFGRVLSAVAPVGPFVDPSTSGLPASGALGGVAVGKSAATLAALGKGFALGIGVSVAAATGNYLLSERSAAHETPAPDASPGTAKAAPSSAPAQPHGAPRDLPKSSSFGGPAAQATPERRPGTANLPATSSQQLPTEPAPSTPSFASFPAADGELALSRLQEEAALLRRARSELRAGALTAAFATLEASRQRFTAPELSQEREALVIELLYRSGEQAAARARAREFLTRFPESPHGAALRSFADESAR